ncbi:40S ribosomal protein S26 [Batrachochytrium dendrobatidis]
MALSYQTLGSMGPLSWEQVLSIPIESENAELHTQQLEWLSNHIVQTRLDVDSPNTTSDNLIHLFSMIQKIIGLKDSSVHSFESQLKQANMQIQNQALEIQRVRAMSTKSTDPAFIEVHHLQDELIQLEHKNAAAIRDIERAEEALDSERSVVAQLTASLKEERTKTSTLQDTNRRLDDELKDARSRLSDQRNHIQSRNIDKDNFRMQLTEKNAELNRYIAEIQMLSTEHSQMATEVESMTQELEAAVCEIETNLKELQECRDLIKHKDEIIDQVTDERDALQIKIEDMVEQLEDLDQQLSSNKDELVNVDNNYQQPFQKNKELQCAHDEVSACQKELQDTTVNELRLEISRKDTIIQTLEKQVEQVNSDFELLSIDWDRLDRQIKQEVQSITNEQAIVKNVREDLNSIKKLRDKLLVYQDRHKANEDAAKQLQEQLADKETVIVKLYKRIDLYEQGTYGLKDAVQEIKNLKLKLRINIREKEDCVRQINHLESQMGDAIEENQELRARLGMDKNSRFDIDAYRKSKTVEAEKSNALNIHLRQEIDRLEEERLQLKSGLRFQALERGERAIALGLTAQDLMSVEEYSNKLRLGTNGQMNTTTSTTKEIIRPILNIDQLDKLTLELERLHVDGIETKQQLWSLQEEHKRQIEETHMLQSAILEVSQSLISMAHQSKQENDFPIVSKLVQILQSKIINSNSGNAIMQIDKSISILNTKLHKQLEEAEQHKKALESEMAKLKEQLVIRENEIKAEKEKSLVRDHHFLHLPTELTLASPSGYSSLVDQLITCMVELREKDLELKECAIVLEQKEELWELTDSKLQMLYKDHNKSKAIHESKVSKLSKALNEANNRESLLSAKIDRLESLLATTEASSDEITRATIDAHRKLIVMQVNEGMLARRYTALSDVEAFLQKENARLKEDLIDMSKSARETILRLQFKKNSTEAVLEKLQHEFANSVPQNQHLLLYNRLQTHISKTRLLMDREREWTEHCMSHEDNRNIIEKQRKEIYKLTVQLDEATQLVNMHNELASKNSCQNPTTDSYAVSMLKVKLEVHERRSELAETRIKTLETLEAEMILRLDSTEKMYTALREEIIQVQEDFLNFKNEHISCLTEQHYQATLKEKACLEDEVGALRQEVQKYKEIADIATNQVADLNALHKMDEKEKQILQAAVQELQMKDDDKLVIGKLHHHILALQMSETVILRKLDCMTSKCLRLETLSLQAEQAKDDRDQLLFDLRIKTKGRVRLMQKTLSELRLKLSGVVPLGKHEKACNMIRILDDRKRKAELQLDAVSHEKQEMELEMKTTKIKLEGVQELLEALNDKSDSQKRMQGWQKKTMCIQTELMKAKKDITQLRLKASISDEECQASHIRIAELENEVLTAESEYAEHQLEWEQHHSELEDIIQQYEEERDKILHDSTAAELSEMLPSHDLPIGNRLEASLRLLTEQGRKLKALEIKISSLEAEKKNSESELKNFSSILHNKDVEINRLQLEISQSKTRDFNVKTEQALVTDADLFEASNKQEADAIDMAKSFTESLQRQIDQKEELVHKYREMVKSIRKEVFSQKEAGQSLVIHKSEVEKLGAIIDELRHDRISRAVKLPDVAPSVSKHEADANSDTIRELEKLLHAKDISYAELQKQLKEISNSAHEEKSNLEDRVSGLMLKLEQKEQLIMEKNNKLETNQKEIEELQAKETILPSVNSSEEVKLLEAGIEQRNAKIHNLTHAVRKLKEQMMQAAKSLAETTIRQTNESNAFQEKLETKTRHLTSKIIELESKVKQLMSIIGSHKQEDANVLNDMRPNKEKEISTKSAENSRLKKALAETKTFTSNALYNEIQIPSLPPLVEKSAKIASTSVQTTSAHSTHVAETFRDVWEIEKRYTRQVEALKKRLSEKTVLSEELGKNVESLRQSCMRSENERIRLQSKLNSMTRHFQNIKLPNRQKHCDIEMKPNQDLPVFKPSTSTDAKETISKLKSDMDLKEKTILDLQEKLKLAVQVNEQSPIQHFDSSIDPNLQIKTLSEKLAHAEHELSMIRKSQSSVEFEYQQSVSEKTRALEKITLLEQKLQFHNLTAVDSAGTSAKTKSFCSKSVDELVAIMDHLTQAVDKLTHENENLRSGTLSQVKYSALFEKNKKLQNQLTELNLKLQHSDTAVSKISRIEEENLKYRKLLRREIDRNKKSSATIQELIQSKEQLVIEIIGLRKSVGGKDAFESSLEDSVELKRRILDLQTCVDEKEKLVQSLLKPDATEQSRLTSENRRLTREVEMWTARATKLSEKIAQRDLGLSTTGICVGICNNSECNARITLLEMTARDLKAQVQKCADTSSVYQELEDLKFNYKECMRLNVKYEAQLQGSLESAS